MTSFASLRSWRLLSALLLSAAVFATGCGRNSENASSSGAPAAENLTSTEQRASYGIGYNLGRDLNQQKDFAPDQAALQAGLEDGLKGKDSRVNEADVRAAFTTLQERANEAMAKAGEANLTAAKAFLEQNKKRPGVKTTDSGLQYEVIKSGNGAKPKSTDTVEVHYHGTLIDGTVFDSSVERGESISFPVTGVIRGWIEALQLMSVGDKWKLTIPPELAYGPQARGKIPANSALIFEVELLGIK